MLSLGPVPMTLVLILFALACAAGTARVLARPLADRPPLPLMSHIWDMLLVGAVVARLAFVLRWWPQYASDPGSILRIHDGGFIAWLGVIGGLAFGFWRTRDHQALRRPLAATAVVGLGVWSALSFGLGLYQRYTLIVPQTQLLRLDDGSTVRLAQLSGKPMVVNLWASWCPPCRREMPVLAQAQQDRSDVIFAFVNQGESDADVRRYLTTEKLPLENVLLDPQSEAGREIRSRGLPATLFFDAQGRLVETHLGPLSSASLAAKMAALAPGSRP